MFGSIGCLDKVMQSLIEGSNRGAVVVGALCGWTMPTTRTVVVVVVVVIITTASPPGSSSSSSSPIIIIMMIIRMWMQW